MRCSATAYDLVLGPGIVITIPFRGEPRVCPLRPVRRRRRRRGKAPRRFWTDAEDTAVRELYPRTPTAEIARQLDRTPRAIYARANTLGISKDPAFVLQQNRELGRRLGTLPASRANQFQKGHRPWTKGRKGYDAGGRSHETRFKRGERNGRAAQLYQPVGAERINADGYRDRKIRNTGYPPRDWRPVHRLLWCEHHGPIPKGHAVVFRNGDKTDIRIENLELISRRQLMARNTVHNLPPELVGAIQARAALVRRINTAKRRER